MLIHHVVQQYNSFFASAWMSDNNQFAVLEDYYDDENDIPCFGEDVNIDSDHEDEYLSSSPINSPDTNPPVVTRDDHRAYDESKKSNDPKVKQEGKEKFNAKHMTVINANHKHDEQCSAADLGRKCNGCGQRYNYKWKYGADIDKTYSHEPAETMFLFCLLCGEVNGWYL